MTNTDNTAFEASNDLIGIDLPEMFRKSISSLRRHYFTVILAGVVFAAAGYGLVRLQAPYYTAQSSIIIDPRINETMGQTQSPAIFLADALVVDSEVEVLRSELLLRRVIDRLDLAAKEKARLEAQGETVDENVLRDKLIGKLARAIEVNRAAKTFVIRIKARGETPALSAALANALAEEYLDLQRLNQMMQTDQEDAWLREQLENSRIRVIEAEKKADLYVFENDIPDSGVAGNVEKEIDQIDQALITARKNIRAINAEIAEINRAANLYDDPAAAAPEAIDAQNELIATLGGREGIRISDVTEELGRLREKRQVQLKIAQNEINSLDRQRRALRAELAKINEKQVRLRDLRREAEALQSQYEDLLERAQRTQSQDRFFRNNARIIERADAPSAPANPKNWHVAMIAGVGGVLAGVGFVFLREQIDDTLRRSDDVMNQLGADYLGPAPRLRSADCRRLLPDLEAQTKKLSSRQRRRVALLQYAATHPYSKMAETFRRTVFAIQSKNFPSPQVISVNSAISEEGKSFFSSNLAFFLSSRGHRVLLIDGDIRRPQLSKWMSPLVAGGETLSNEMLALGKLTQNLDFLYCNPSQRTPQSEALMGALQEALLRVRSDYDFMIVDTAPLAYVSDSLALAPVIDGAVLVVDWGRTTAGALRRVLHLNVPIAEKLVGVCLSKSPRHGDYEYIPSTNKYYDDQ